MITIFNRQEIFSTFDSAQYYDAKQKLLQAGIPYRTGLINLQRNGRSGMTSLQMKYAVQYRIFVHQKDAERAAHCLHHGSAL